MRRSPVKEQRGEDLGSTSSESEAWCTRLRVIVCFRELLSSLGIYSPTLMQDSHRQSGARGGRPSAPNQRRDARLKKGGPERQGSTAPADSGPISIAGALADAVRPEIWPVAAICAVACVSLGVQWFVGSDRTFYDLFMSPRDSFNAHWIFLYKAWWIACVTTSFLVLPALFMALLPGKRLRDCNLSWPGFRDHFWIYVGLYAAVLPVIWLISLAPTFTDFYPMYPLAGRSWFDLLAWEGMYIVQFVAVEFFFRGFLVGGLGKQIGILSVPVSVMPYFMLHFTKLWPEASASVVAGFVLGWLAWKTKSIWGGVMVHCAVAVTMDLLALSHKSQLPWLHG